MTPTGTRPADVVVANGRIVEVVAPTGEADVDLGSNALLPGCVDVHVHINEPGRTHWEGFETATRAAAAGGTTTLVDMPLNSVPSTTTVEAFEAKLEAAEGKLTVDVGYWGGVVPNNVEDLRGLWDRGVLGFKCFMIDSGVDEFAWVTVEDLDRAMPVLAELGAPLLAHAELAEPILAIGAGAEANPMSYGWWLDRRPQLAEVQAIRALAALSERHGCRAHVVHLAAPEAFELLREVREKNPKFTVETCAHYLTFAAEEVPDGATEFKCAPPIRQGSVREELWRALGSGLIDFVTTDHSPSPMDLKSPDEGRFDESWGGVPSVQLLLSATWTGASARGFSLDDVARWVAERPARFAGLADRKGCIAVGYDADMVAFDSEAEWVVEREGMYHRHQYTPYEGRKLRGRIMRTWLRGSEVWDGDGGFSAPRGVSIMRTR